MNDHETSDLLKVLVAANELLLQELVDYLQKYLIENKLGWTEFFCTIINLQELQ